MKRRPNKLFGMPGRTLALCFFLGVPFVATSGQDPIAQEVRDLERKLKSHDVSERAAAAWRLGEIGARASSAAPTLRLAFSDTFPRARINAIMAHRTITGDSSRAGAMGLVGLLDDDDHIIRWDAAVYLEKVFINAELAPWVHELVPALVKSLANDSYWVREAAAQGLFKLGCVASSALPALIARVKVEESKNILEDVVKAIGATACSSPEAIGALIEILGRESDLPTIDAAVEALERISLDAVPALIVAMKEEDVDLAREALRALWRLAPADSGDRHGKPRLMLALPALMELADGDDEELRYMAVRTIGKLGWVAHESVPVLVRALKSPQLRTRRAAAWSLGQFANFAKESADALALLRRDSDPRLRALATWAHRSVTREVP